MLYQRCTARCAHRRFPSFGASRALSIHAKNRVDRPHSDVHQGSAGLALLMRVCTFGGLLLYRLIASECSSITSLGSPRLGYERDSKTRKCGWCCQLCRTVCLTSLRFSVMAVVTDFCSIRIYSCVRRFLLLTRIVLAFLTFFVLKLKKLLAFFPSSMPFAHQYAARRNSPQQVGHKELLQTIALPRRRTH